MINICCSKTVITEINVTAPRMKTNINMATAFFTNFTSYHTPTPQVFQSQWPLFRVMDTLCSHDKICILFPLSGTFLSPSPPSLTKVTPIYPFCLSSVSLSQTHFPDFSNQIISSFHTPSQHPLPILQNIYGSYNF